MELQDIQKKIAELKTAQSDYFKKKKADRISSEIDAVRTELNELKKKLKQS
jgi:polyhydroxyalkanoate synthesis regulator phasin